MSDMEQPTSSPPQPPQLTSAFMAAMQARFAVPLWAIIVSALLCACLACAFLSEARQYNQAVAAASGSSSSGQAVVAPTATAIPAATATPRPTATPAPTATPTRIPTPTRVPQWTTVQHFGGSVNQQTDTFHIADGAHIAWSYTITDSANFFALSLYSSDGSLVDVVANYANESSGHQSTYTVHGGGDYYLNIESNSATWTVDVQELQ
jgi:hypothetical protein